MCLLWKMPTPIYPRQIKHELCNVSILWDALLILGAHRQNDRHFELHRWISEINSFISPWVIWTEF